MSPFTSFISENTPIPDPPHLKYIGLVVSCLLTIGFLFFSFFIVFEFSLDMFGIPIQFGANQNEITTDSPDDESLIESKDMSPQEIVPCFELLSPLPDSCISNGKVTVLCTWHSSQRHFQTLPLSMKDLKVDGISFSWDEQFGNNTWFTHLTLEPGQHQIQSQVFDAKIFVADSNHSAPADWKRFSMHPLVSNPRECGSCHYLLEKSDVIVRKGYNLAIGDWKGNESCLTCHQNERYETAHFNLAAPETDCNACHAVHGAVNSDKLLKYQKNDFKH